LGFQPGFDPDQKIALRLFNDLQLLKAPDRALQLVETTFMLSLIYGHFSRDYAKSQIAKGNGGPSYEAVVEFGHRVQATKFLFVQPDFQWVIRPSGTGRYPNAIAAGAEMGITF
jgi:carbohydrate-selective porin OprB